MKPGKLPIHIKPHERKGNTAIHKEKPKVKVPKVSDISRRVNPGKIKKKQHDDKKLSIKKPKVAPPEGKAKAKKLKSTEPKTAKKTKISAKDGGQSNHKPKQSKSVREKTKDIGKVRKKRVAPHNDVSSSVPPAKKPKIQNKDSTLVNSHRVTDGSTPPASVTVQRCSTSASSNKPLTSSEEVTTAPYIAKCETTKCPPCNAKCEITKHPNNIQKCEATKHLQSSVSTNVNSAPCKTSVNRSQGDCVGKAHNVPHTVKKEAKQRKIVGKQLSVNKSSSQPVENGPVDSKSSQTPRPPSGAHPHRMASLDALAKMHVLCTTERRGPVQEGGHQESEEPPVQSKEGDVIKAPVVQTVEAKTKKPTIQLVQPSSAAAKCLKMNVKQKAVNKSAATGQSCKPKSGSSARPGASSENISKGSGGDKLAKQKVRQKIKGDIAKKPKPKPSLKGNQKGKDSKDTCKHQQIQAKKVKMKKADAPGKLIAKKIVKRVKAPNPKVNKLKPKEETKKKRVKVRETFKMRQTCTFRSVTVNSKTTKNTVSDNKRAVTQVTKVKKAVSNSVSNGTMKILNRAIHKEESSDKNLSNKQRYCFQVQTTYTPTEKLAGNTHSHVMNTIVQEGQECCGYLTHSPVIPVAHAQSCPLTHGLHRVNMSLVSVSPQTNHYENTFPVPRFSSQRTLLYPSREYGCYHCAGSVMQPLHDSCLMHESVPYHHHHHPPSAPAVSQHPFPEGLCSSCHRLPSLPTPCQPCLSQTDHTYSQDPHPAHQISKPSTKHAPFPGGGWSTACRCFEQSQLDTHQHPCLYSPPPSGSPTDYLTPEYHQTVVPTACDQAPLDLSSASVATTDGLPEVTSSAQPLYQNTMCCGRSELVLCTPPSRRTKGRSSKVCCSCGEPSLLVLPGSRTRPQQEQCVERDAKDVRPVLVRLTTDDDDDDEEDQTLANLANSTKTVHIIRLRQQVTNSGETTTSARTSSDRLKRCNAALLSVEHIRKPSAEDQKDIVAAVKAVGMTKINGSRVGTVPYKVNLAARTWSPATKQEKTLPVKPSSLFPKKLGKRKFLHGWSWEGEEFEKMIALTNDSPPISRRCYLAMRHVEGDVIQERDCVLLRSGPRSTDLPFVAKVAALWENPDDGEMMMSLLWYYRPEHTELGRRPGQMEDEVFASKHKDVNSVACIEDKCYVLTFAEYCRYRSQLRMAEDRVTPVQAIVPDLQEGYFRRDRLPKGCVSPEMVFFCRSVYDFRQKRILKNPT